MTVKCYICNDDIEITIDELVEYGQEEDVDARRIRETSGFVIIVVN